jgi:hypothetical protein
MDNSDRKSYGKDSYKSQFQSYIPDYKPQYSSYDKKDDRDKSKDRSKSVDINKIKCINTNLNINGNNTGDINLGNKGQVAAEGYSGAYSSGGGGYDGNEGYYDGNYKKDKGITCIINNNNNNTNIVTGGGGNVTDGNGNVTDTCEECFLDALGLANLTKLETYLTGLPLTSPYNSLEEYCTFIESQIASGLSPGGLAASINTVLVAAGITLDTAELEDLVACLIEVLTGETDNNTGSLAPSNINTETGAGSLAPSNINTDNSDFGPMMTLPTPTPSMETSDK